jgi:hypothetical protein
MLGRREQLLKSNPWFEEIFAGGKMEINILIVADGIIAFVESEFGLSELINKALRPSANIWERLEIIKAHRADNGKGADICGFRFDETPKPPHNYSLSHYDQIWLFGFESEKDARGKPNQFTLSDSELRELAKFMNEGGGVFAAGDHEDLGAALCGRVPRVRNMRKWFLADSPPSRDSETRLDTLREGIDQGFIASDQSDRFPQEIRPIFKLNGARSGSLPHPILRKDGFAITVLPDHMHEGECVLPTDLTEEITLDDGTKFKEYPYIRCENERLSPEVVALSTSVGGFVDQLDPALPVIPRCFNVIVAYDGHQVGKANEKYEKDWVGRVVVDSSFHHFIDTNLRGTASGNKLKTGLYDECDNPTKDYLAIKQYYRNLVLWLCPPEKQASYYLHMLLSSRYVSPLVEEIRSIENPKLEDIIFAGVSTHRAIASIFSHSDATKCAIHAVAALSNEVKTGIVSLFEPWEATASDLPAAVKLINLDLILKLVLGGAMLGIANRLPETPVDVHRLLPAEQNARYEQLQGFVSGGLLHAGKVVAQTVPESQHLMGKFLETLKATI